MGRDRQETRALAVLEDDRGEMERALEAALQAVPWPRETIVAFELLADRGLLCLDVDLPEIEDIPRWQARVAARGFKLNVSSLDEREVRRVYAHHVHATLFRCVGEAFTALPSIQAVICSGFSQRSQAFSEVKQDYLISTIVDRERWSELNFGSLARLDPMEVLGGFRCRRSMSKDWLLEPITPFEAVDLE